MTDIILEILRAAFVGSIVVFLLFNRNIKKLKKIKGWRFFTTGFVLVFFAMLIDITDNFESLKRFILIGDTKYQAIIEKLFGYLCGFIFIAIGIRSWIPSVIELQNKRKEELKKAAEKIKALSGLLPICAHCKKIRDEKGYWKQIESYISEHSEAVFSHGICPECAGKLYTAYRKKSDDAQPTDR
jgi:hypothetical protein